MIGKTVYMFEEESVNVREALGRKGANLADMMHLGIPVPAGFTILAEACNDYDQAEKSIQKKVKDDLVKALSRLEETTGKQMGSSEKPLLVSVTFGAAFSMSGASDTVLHVGMNDQTVQSVAHLTNNPRFAYGAYHRFIQQFCHMVLKVNPCFFEKHLEQVRKQKGYDCDLELTEKDWKQVIAGYKIIIKKQTKSEFPQKPIDQLVLVIQAIFDSWHSEQSVVYRRLNKISNIFETAINIQSMVFGNTGEESAAGTAFTRNPVTGKAELYGEYLINAQKADVAAGIRTPNPIQALTHDMPHVFEQLRAVSQRLEEQRQEMQHIEFIVERGQLFILDICSGKCRAPAAIRLPVKAETGSQTKALFQAKPEQLFYRRINH